MKKRREKKKQINQNTIWWSKTNEWLHHKKNCDKDNLFSKMWRLCDNDRQWEWTINLTIFTFFKRSRLCLPIRQLRFLFDFECDWVQWTGMQLGGKCLISFFSSLSQGFDSFVKPLITHHKIKSFVLLYFHLVLFIRTDRSTSVLVDAIAFCFSTWNVILLATQQPFLLY